MARAPVAGKGLNEITVTTSIAVLVEISGRRARRPASRPQNALPQKVTFLRPRALKAYSRKHHAKCRRLRYCNDDKSYVGQ